LLYFLKELLPPFHILRIFVLYIFHKYLFLGKYFYIKVLYNKYNAQFDYLGLGDQICVGNKEYSIQGIYADKVFSYFEFSVLAKNGSKELTDEIERFLFENDCKLRFIYTDIIIDLDDYEEPIDQYLNEIFIQLNPTLFIKRNVYFMNQQFTNDNYLMFVFGDDEKPEVKPLYSR
jgi:hypothetical protein